MEIQKSERALESCGGRLGFTFEGVFRQSAVIKGHNRNTVWFSMLDSEWPSRDAAFRSWLDPANFDRDGNQVKGLAPMCDGLAAKRS